jgi:hypothetical protein
MVKYQRHHNNLSKIKKALFEYENSDKSLSDISKQFNIPISTLNYYKNKLSQNQQGGNIEQYDNEKIVIDTSKRRNKNFEVIKMNSENPNERNFDNDETYSLSMTSDNKSIVMPKFPTATPTAMRTSTKTGTPDTSITHYPSSPVQSEKTSTISTTSTRKGKSRMLNDDELNQLMIK